MQRVQGHKVQGAKGGWGTKVQGQVQRVQVELGCKGYKDRCEGVLEVQGVQGKVQTV